METLIHVGLMNALFAAILAVLVAGLALLFRRRPALVHALWVLVLVKFLVPSVFPIEIPCWRASPGQSESPVPAGAQQNPEPQIALIDQPLDLAEAYEPRADELASDG